MAHAGVKRLVGNQSARGVIVGAVGLTAIKTAMRMLGTQNWLGRFEQPAESAITGAILDFSGAGGGSDLLSAGVKEIVSEGIGVGIGMLTGGGGGASMGGGVVRGGGSGGESL